MREEQKYIVYSWREQAIVREIASMISIVACCHGEKLCSLATRNFRSQQNGAVTRIGTKRGESFCEAKILTRFSVKRKYRQRSMAASKGV